VMDKKTTGHSANKDDVRSNKNTARADVKKRERFGKNKFFKINVFLIIIVLIIGTAGFISLQINLEEKTVVMDQILFELEEGGSNPHLKATIYIRSLGTGDSGDITMHVLIRSADGPNTKYLDMLEPIHLPSIKDDKTATANIEMDLDARRYDIEFRLYENGRHRETDIQTIVLTQQDIQKEGELRSTVIPEFPTQTATISILASTFMIIGGIKGRCRK